MANLKQAVDFVLRQEDARLLLRGSMDSRHNRGGARQSAITGVI